MCLGVPMRVVDRDGFIARCEAKGIERSVSLFLLQHEDVGPGDHVMVHVGYAIQKMSEADAASAWELLDEMLTAEDELLTADEATATPDREARARA
jgi:hydrogenase expression/formation protein HypC